MDDLLNYNDSDVVVPDPVYLIGLWLHDPDDPTGTSLNYQIGRDMRSYSAEVGGAQLVFAGREFPVTDFGEHRSDTFSIGLIIPNGDTYNEERRLLSELVLSRKTIVARDNRGVVIYGTVGDLPEEHESQGSSYSFEVTRVHRETFEVA